MKSNMMAGSGAARLLLMVAVLVVGTCASGARADSKVDLVSLCTNDTIVLLYNSTVNDVVIPAGKTVGINLSFLQGLVAPVYFRKSGALNVLTPAGLSQILGLTGVIYEIEIACDGECGVGVLTIKPDAQLYAAGLKVGGAITVCANLVVA